MKTFVTTVLFSVFSFFIYGQNARPLKSKKGSIGIDVFSSFENIGGNLFRESTFKEISSSANGFGVNYNFRTSNQWELSIGAIWKVSSRNRKDEIEVLFENPNQLSVVPFIMIY